MVESDEDFYEEESMDTNTKDVNHNKKNQGKGVDKKRKAMLTLKYGNTHLPKKQAKVVISSDEYEDDGDEIDMDIQKEGTRNIAKSTKKKHKMGKGELNGGQRFVSPQNFIKDWYGDTSSLEEQDIYYVPTQNMKDNVVVEVPVGLKSRKCHIQY